MYGVAMLQLARATGNAETALPGLLEER
jgi:hypothetical protein